MWPDMESISSFRFLVSAAAAMPALAAVAKPRLFVLTDLANEPDDDGNQTLIKTAIGVWQVQYNGENRPVL